MSSLLIYNASVSIPYENVKTVNTTEGVSFVWVIMEDNTQINIPKELVRWMANALENSETKGENHGTI